MPLQHPEDFSEHLPAILGPNEVQHAVRDDAIDALVGDQRMFAAETLFRRAQLVPIGQGGNRTGAEFLGQAVQVEPKVLNHAILERDIVRTPIV